MQTFDTRFSILLLLIFITCSNSAVASKHQKNDVANNNHQHADNSITKWKEASFEIITPGYKTFKTSKFANVFVAQKNCIVRVAPELEGLTGIKLAVTNGAVTANDLKVRFSKPVKLLVGIFRDSAKPFNTDLSSVNFTKGKLQPNAVLQNGVTITGLPSVDVYAIDYPKGIHSINFSKSFKGLYTILGVVVSNQKLTSLNVGFPDGRLWDPFIVEGFYDDSPLFEVISGIDTPVVDEVMPGTEGIQGGFEGGAVVKVGNTYHLFPTERAGEQGVPAYHDRVKTRIGHWTSTDAIHWTRKSTIYQASGTYAITHDDNPLNDRRGAIWSYMPIFNKEKNRWYGYYLTYTVDKDISPNHSFGRIWKTESKTEGINGIGGPYDEGKLIMEPGLSSQLWEGRQGVASFFPYPVKDHWLAFYAGAYPYLKREDYPDKMGKGWFVGLAESNSLDSAWTRLDTTINPVTSIHPSFVENPIVYEMPNGLYLAIFDGGPEGWGHHLPNMMGYTISKDGYTWSEARYIPFETKVKKWWDIMRTPLCLIPEGNNIYTIVYAAINNNKRFHPMGMVKVKMDPNVLEDRKNELK